MHDLFSVLSTTRAHLSDFWKRMPALHIGLSLLMGIAIFFFPWLIIATLPLLVRRSALLIPIGTAYALWTAPVDRTDPIEGHAYFAIDTVHKHRTPFSTSYCYTGRVRSMCNAPARIYTKKKSYPANCSYIIPNATLSPSNILSSQSTWEKVPHTFSLAELRFAVKSRVKTHLRRHYKGPAYDLLAALATGDVESRELRHYFRQLGLAHIIAISGFHFALLAALLSLLVRFPLPIILLLALYAFYIGPSPSVSRAHIAISLFLIARMSYLRTSPLNALGVALTCALVADPHIISHIGFQLSFSATLGILLFFRPCEQMLRRLLPGRPYATLAQMPLLDQHGYLLSACIRNTLALSIAVQGTLLPLLLYHFHVFPLLSLLYNLFIPFLIVIGCSLLLFPFLSPLNSAIMNGVIALTTYPPKKYAFAIRVADMPEWIAIVLLIGILLRGIALYQREGCIASRSDITKSMVPR